MKTHTIRLHPKPFQKVKSGKKTIESRLSDAKRQLFKVGDKLVFVSRQNGSQIFTTITTLHKQSCFRELFSLVPLEKLGADNSDILLAEISEYYSEEDQSKWGVVGIEFKISTQ